MSDYETEPSMPQSGGFGSWPVAQTPHDDAELFVDKTTGVVLEGRVLEPAAAETSIDVVQRDVVDQLVNGGTDALDVFRDPESVRRLSHEVKTRLLEQLEQYAATHRARRPAGRATPSTLSPELNALSDAHDVLDTIAGVFTAGAGRAKEIVGEITHELADDPRKGSQSVKVADSHGADLKVTRTQPTKVVVDEDEIIDVLVSHAVSDRSPDPRWEDVLLDRDSPDVDLRALALVEYAAGARAAIAAYRRIAAAHAFKTTELDAWARDLDAQELHDLSIRLGHAYGRVSHGKPQVKIDRVSRKGSDAIGDETAQS